MPNENFLVTLKRIMAVAVLLSLAGCATAPPRPQEIAHGDYAAVGEYAARLIDSEMRRHDVTGLSIALVDDQRLVWAQGFGYADKARKLPASPQTLYRVGSISKLFTATAAMQLAEQGKLDIDQPLRSWLPEFVVRLRDGQAEITSRNIMTHHSGLPRDYLAGMWSAQPEPFTVLAARLPPDSAAYPPGLLFSYSNVGVTLLGHALQNVSGQPFASYLQDVVLNPIGMTSSSFSSAVPATAQMSRGYRNGNEAREPALRDVPAGGLNTSAQDLGRFMAMVFAGGQAGDSTILRSATVDEMLRPQNEGVALDLNFRTGLGWVLGGLGGIAIENAGPVAHHSGATILFHSMLIVLPQHKLGVVVLANSESSGPAVNKVAVEVLQLALQAKTGIRPEMRTVAKASERPVAPETGRIFAGDYATLAGYVHVEYQDGKLSAQAAGAKFVLEPREDGTFGLRYALLGLIPVGLGEELGNIGLVRKQVAGREVIVAQTGGQQMLAGEKLLPAPLSDKWLERLGEYEIVNLGQDEAIVKGFKLRRENGFLLFDVALASGASMLYSVPLLPRSDTEAYVAGMLRDYGETMHIVSRNGEERLLFAGYELRRKAK